MNDFLKKTYKYIIALVVGFTIGILINLPSCQKQPEPEIIKVPVHDTITIQKDSIVYKTKIVDTYRIDTFYITKDGDSVQVVDIPITNSVYKDTIKSDSTSTEIEVNFHGFNAGIDSISLVHNYNYEKEIIVKPPKKVGLIWFVGPGVGYGVHGSVNTGTFGHGPEIGLVVGLGFGGIIK